MAQWNVLARWLKRGVFSGAIVLACSGLGWQATAQIMPEAAHVAYKRSFTIGGTNDRISVARLYPRGATSVSGVQSSYERDLGYVLEKVFEGWVDDPADLVQRSRAGEAATFISREQFSEIARAMTLVRVADILAISDEGNRRAHVHGLVDFHDNPNRPKWAPLRAGFVDVLIANPDLVTLDDGDRFLEAYGFAYRHSNLAAFVEIFGKLPEADQFLMWLSLRSPFWVDTIDPDTGEIVPDNLRAQEVRESDLHKVLLASTRCGHDRDRSFRYRRKLSRQEGHGRVWELRRVPKAQLRSFSEEALSKVSSNDIFHYLRVRRVKDIQSKLDFPVTAADEAGRTSGFVPSC